MDGTKNSERNIEAVVAVYDSRNSAGNAVRALDRVGLDFSEIDATLASSSDVAGNDLKRLFFSEAEGVDSSDVIEGMAKGAAIGGVAGAFFLAVPIVGLMAPIGGALGGALIGGMAGIDESIRESRLPSLAEYRQMIAAGKALVIIPGDEEFRIQMENELKKTGAESVNQHPPVSHAVRTPEPVPEDDDGQQAAE